MKKNIFIYSLLILGMGFIACHAKGGKQVRQTCPTDSLIYKELGKSLTEVLFSPSRVRCFSVKNVASPQADDLAFDPNFVRDTLIMKLSGQEQAILQYILLSNTDNYHIDNPKVRSPYFPNLAFEFKKGKRIAYVLISTSDYSWSVYYDDKVQFNYNYTDRNIIERFCNYYLQLKNKGEQKK